MQFPVVSTVIPCLAIVLVLSLPLHEGAGQSNQLALAQDRLIEAFRKVQELDLQGASSSETARLGEELNRALANLEKANQTGSDSYATLSAEISSQVSARAQVVAEATEGQALLSRLSAYAVAILMGGVSSLIVVEFDRIKSVLRRRKPLRIRMV